MANDEKGLYTIPVLDGKGQEVTNKRGYALLIADKPALIDAIAAHLASAPLNFDLHVAENPAAISMITQGQLSEATTLIVQGSKYEELKPLVDRFTANFTPQHSAAKLGNFSNYQTLLITGDQQDKKVFKEAKGTFTQKNLQDIHGEFMGDGSCFSNLEEVGQYVYSQTKIALGINRGIARFTHEGMLPQDRGTNYMKWMEERRAAKVGTAKA